MAGKYTREREIGRGGMGAVWLGHDVVLDRAVALKRVGMVPGGSTPDLERAEREARLAAALNHPHVVAVFDLVADGDEHWLVMEYVDGMSLAELIRRDGPMTRADAASVLWQTADALAAAHGAGIVHRDVKPSNILITRDGDAKLTDFGIARAEADASLTQTGLITGSPAYLAPEVASGQSATAASDVWAIGATLFHALAGRPPYEVGDNVLAAMYQIVHEAPPRLDDAGWLAPLLEHTMATDPADRWSTERVRDFLRDGRSTADDDTTPATRVLSTGVAERGDESPAGEHTASLPPVPPVSPVPPVPAEDDPSQGRDRATGTRSAWPWVSAAAAVLLMTAFAFWLGLSNGGDDTADNASDRTSAPQDPTSQSQSPSPSPSEPTAPASTPPAVSAQEMEAFIGGYLATVTTDPKSAWQQLTRDFQKDSGGYGTYKGFWSTIADATLLEVQADPDVMRVTYTVRYDLADGGQTTDTVTLQLTAEDDRLLIAAEA